MQRVILVEPANTMRRVLRVRHAGRPGFEVVGSVADAVQALGAEPACVLGRHSLSSPVLQLLARAFAADPLALRVVALEMGRGAEGRPRKGDYLRELDAQLAALELGTGPQHAELRRFLPADFPVATYAEVARVARCGPCEIFSGRHRVSGRRELVVRIAPGRPGAAAAEALLYEDLRQRPPRFPFALRHEVLPGASFVATLSLPPAFARRLAGAAGPEALADAA